MRDAIRRMVLAVVYLFLVFAGVLFGGSAPAWGRTHTFDKTYPLAQGGTFTLDNINGSVQVEGWERDEVEVQAVKTARHAESDAELVSIDVDSDPANVAVHTRYPDGDGAEVAVEYHIHVPYRVLLSGVGTVNGSVQVRDIEGGGELRSVNGDVDVRNSGGRFNARTTNGNVHLELRNLPDGNPMKISTVNGSVMLALPAKSNAELTARSMNGEFRSELPIDAPGALGLRFCHGRLGSGGGALVLNTVNGEIRVVAQKSVD
jgi:DUF4097 and DUF4098 domain-containing protein YvlB